MHSSYIKIEAMRFTKKIMSYDTEKVFAKKISRNMIVNIPKATLLVLKATCHVFAGNAKSAEKPFSMIFGPPT